MGTLVDLSHTIRPGMPRYKGLPSPHVGAVWTHAEASSRGYRDTTCEVTEVQFVTSIGTYLDAPYHFDPCGEDVSQLNLERVVLPGIAVDLRPVAAGGTPLPARAVDGIDITDKAVLLVTGWSDHWEDEHYHNHPFIARPLAERMRAGRPALVGIDALMVDSPSDPARPAHTLLLRAGILIVENLTGLDQLLGRQFTFVAAPVKVSCAAAFPVRAYAVVRSSSAAVAEP